MGNSESNRNTNTSKSGDLNRNTSSDIGNQKKDQQGAEFDKKNMPSGGLKDPNRGSSSGMSGSPKSHGDTVDRGLKNDRDLDE